MTIATDALVREPGEAPDRIETSAARRSSAKTVLRAAFDHPLFSYRLVVVTSVVLVVLGLLMVISASSVTAAAQTDDPYYFGKRQIMFAVAGVIGAIALASLPEKVLRLLAWPAMLLGLMLLMLTFTPLGVDIAGNRNWVSFGPSWTQFQPSEFAKVAIILWGAYDLSHRRRRLRDLRQWLVYVVLAFSMIALVVLQKDMGTAVVMAAMVILILVGAGAPWRLLMAIGVMAVVGATVLVLFQPNRMQRILGFLNPDLDPLGINQQADRGIFALASGGWFGQGLGASRQKWGLLAEAHTDYIFAIIGEELGLVGAVVVIGLFTVLAYAGLRIATRSRSGFNRLVAIGVVAWFTVQAFINIAVAIRAFPVMGVTLPMISYGGSSLMANLFALGLLVGCSRQEPEAAALLAARKRPARNRSVVGVST